MRNKLVTIFARHLDSFIMTINFSHFCQFFSGSGQIRNAGTNYHSPGLAKIAPWWLARRDSFAAKVPGLMVGVAAPPTLSAHTRWPLGCNYTFLSRLPACPDRYAALPGQLG
jgi:hypothetical protein